MTIESALVELRSVFPAVQIIVSVRDCGTETTTVRGTSLEYGIQIGMNGQDFDADTLTKAVRAAKRSRR